MKHLPCLEQPETCYLAVHHHYDDDDDDDDGSGGCVVARTPRLRRNGDHLRDDSKHGGVRASRDARSRELLVMEPVYDDDGDDDDEKGEGGDDDDDLKLEHEQGNEDADATAADDDAHPEVLVRYRLRSAERPSRWLTCDPERGTVGFAKRRHRTKKRPSRRERDGEEETEFVDRTVWTFREEEDGGTTVYHASPNDPRRRTWALTLSLPARDENDESVPLVENDDDRTDLPVVLLDSSTSKIVTTWSIERGNGELCFVSLATDGDNDEDGPRSRARRHLRCDLTGKLSLASSPRGWEVWRFTTVRTSRRSGAEHGRRHRRVVRVTSWAHSTFALCSDATGRVLTLRADDAARARRAAPSDPAAFCRGWDEWTVSVTAGRRGTVLTSTRHGRVLRVSSTDGKLFTGPPAPDESTRDAHDGNWDLESAHRQTYDLYLQRRGDHVGKRLTAQAPLLSLPSPAAMFSLWRRKREDDSATGDATPAPAPPVVALTKNPIPKEADRWRVVVTAVEREAVVIALFSLARERYLASDEDGRIFLSSQVMDPDASWYLREAATAATTTMVSEHNHDVDEEEEEEETIDFEHREEEKQESSSSAADDEKDLSALLDRHDEPRSSDDASLSSSLASGHVLLSKAHPGRCLDCDERGALVTTLDDASMSPSPLWRLAPRLPRRVDASKIRTVALASAAAAATTVALPFAAAGALGAAGVAEASIVAEAVLGTAVAAEALASVVVVGTTARALLRSERACVGRGGAADAPPLCAWREW